jgi:hypothetical protein
MVYSSGGLIQATDFNTRVASVNQLWGTGGGDYGYGQGSTVGTNSAGSVVPASDWATLIARMSSMQQHQFNNTSGIPSQPTSGSIITYLSTVDTAITSLQNNRKTVYSTSAGAATTGSNGTGWVTQAQRSFTVTFSSGDTARYFFNSGGYIELNFSGTSLSGNSKSNYWNSFITSGIVNHRLYASSSSYGGSGFSPTTNSTGSGYYNLTTSATTWFQVYDNPSSADYTNNYVYIQYKSNGTQGSNSDKGSVITIDCYFVDAAGDVFNDTVSGTLVAGVLLGSPETTYISNTWGTPSISNTVNSQS